MVDRTSIASAPWTLVEANNKYYARIKALYDKRDKLNLDAESKYLLERYALRQVSSPRDLLHPTAVTAKARAYLADRAKEPAKPFFLDRKSVV